MKKELRPLPVEEVVKRKELREVDKVLDRVKERLVYQGTFTLVTVSLDLGKRNIVGEGISRKSLGCKEVYRPETGYNEALGRALEALDKKLRRGDGYIGNKYEG